MAKAKEPFNPFYGLLIVMGTLFCVTACAYGVMAFTAVRTGPITAGEAPGARLLVFLDQQGAKLLAGELSLLAIATFGAMGFDRRVTLRAEREKRAKQISDAAGVYDASDEPEQVTIAGEEST